MLGLMSDIHGNRTAGDAVLADAATLAIDEWWVLSDLVALGPDPVGVHDSVRALPNVRVVAGDLRATLPDGTRLLAPHYLRPFHAVG